MTTRVAALTPKALGVLAVVGMVVAFSLSSTLVKRAESPGVLVAFWRLVTVSVIWNVYAPEHGPAGHARRPATGADPRRLLRPQPRRVLRGRDAQQRRQRRAHRFPAPFFIVPVGAWLFREHIDPRALVFALVAFGGVALVLLSAPPNGDASLEGNVFGVIAMLLLVAYVASTRYFRRQMDVAVFMATICPIAAVAVLPLAIAHGDIAGLSGRGWTYMLILTLTSGVAAQGLMVFAQKTIQIGTIGIAQVAQPALAVVWSYLLLAEVINHRQMIGIALVVAGLFGFVVLNQRRRDRAA